jgi:catechol 2,3-dioxygenase-like lactoylglutathione lyase family enzyme
MLRRSAGPGRWLGLALRVADLKAADAWFSARGFKLHYDPGMESIYFLIGRKQALGVRLEIVAHDMPNDPRIRPGWNPDRWRDDHPLGIEGLQAIGVSTSSLELARETFAARLDLPELGERDLPGEQARCGAYALGDTVIEAMEPLAEDTQLAAHVRDTQGIWCLTFKVRSAAAAAAYLRGKGFELTGSEEGRFAVVPEQAHGRLIWFTQYDVPGYPPLGSKLTQPAEFAA